MESATAPHLTLDGISARFGETLAVSAVSLSVARGELVALLGPSGCGKTTTLRMVAGFVSPSAGRILLDGKDLTRVPAHRRNMGVVFQSYALFPHLDVIDNVAFGLRMRGLGAAERRRKAGQALELVALTHLASRYPGQLSGGQQQRVALARALVIEPSVLLLDEPLSNLDAHLRADMRHEIRDLQRRLAITTLFVTHDQEEALAMSDRIGVMNAGRLVETGTPQALCDRPHDAFTAGFLGARTVIAGKTTGGVFAAPGLAYHGAPEAAKAIVLRAARLSVTVPADDPLALEGRLESATYLGDTWELDIMTAAGPVRVLSPSALQPPAIGALCRIGAGAGGASFIA
jgi:putative spermidine/putrescine transport system ATP-binding protein